jgi:hypothetical protein
MSILNSPIQDLISMVNYFKLAKKKHIRRNQMKDTLNKRKCVKSTKRILNNCLKNDIKRAIINQCKIQLSHFKDSFAHTFIGLKFTSYCSESGGWKCCYRPIENVKPGQKKNHDFNWIFFYDLHIAISSTKLFHGFTLLSLNRCWQLKTQSVSHRFFIRLILTEYFHVLYKKMLFHPSVL